MKHSPELTHAISPVATGCQLALTVAPRAAANRLELGRDGSLKVRLTAPPVDGAANDALLKLLAKALGLPRSRFTLAAGTTSRQKRVLVSGIAPDDLAGRIRGALFEPDQR